MRSSLLLFATALLGCTGQYCSSGPTTTVDGNLGAVRLTGDTKSISDDTNCPGTVGPKDLTHLVADVSFGKLYTLQYTVTTCGNWFPVLSGAWIDWNQNQIWEEEEKLGPFSTAMNNVTVNFEVPKDAKSGLARLRVQVQETQATSLNPCSNFPYGGTKDFTVDVGTLCPTGPATTLDMNLGAVQLKGDSKNIADDTDCPGQIGPIDLRSTQIADVVLGSNYSISWKVTSCGDFWPTLSGAWADYNRDGVFSKDELLGPLTPQQGTVTQSFVVPEDLDYLGNITLRVQVQETYATDVNPCSDFAYGGTKDFTFEIKDTSSRYCQSGPTTLGLTAIGEVSLPGETKTIVNEALCPGVLGPLDDTDQVADLRIGGAYTLSYSVLNCTASHPDVYSTAWIDFDQNQVFNGYEQIVVETNSYGNLSPRFKVPISTPSNVVKTGLTRLRLMVQERSTPGLQACDKFSGGGTKDFSVNILN